MAKTILITGGGKRIGALMVSYLRELGHNLIFTYNTTICQDTNSYKLDLFNPVEISQFWKTLGKKVDVLINNAGYFQADDLENFSHENLQRHMSINLTAPILMSQHFAMQADNGIIINLLDKWCKTTPNNFLSYTLSKNALETFTHYLNHNYSQKIHAYGIELGFTLYNENFSPNFFNSHKDLYPSTPTQLASVLDFIISGGKVTKDIIDLSTWK